MAGPVLARLWEAKESRAVPRSLVRLLAGFALTLVVMFALTATLPRGLGHWQEFRSDLAVHAGTPAPNLVGLTQALAWKPGPRKSIWLELRALWERRSTIHRVSVAILLPLAFIAVVLLARGAGAAGSIGWRRRSCS